MREFAPVVLFTYNRLSETRQTVRALENNYLAADSELYIFSDGPKNLHDEKKILEVRKFLRNVNGFKKVHFFESDKNKGLAHSVINGVTKVLDIKGKLIVLEDDLVSSPNFLDFMNQALDFYEDVHEIISISGYTLKLPSLKNYEKDYYLGQRASSWGWGMWKDRWDKVDWKVSDYNKFKKNYKNVFAFYNIGSDMPWMLKNQMNGKIDSWAIRLCYHQFKNNMLTVFASSSKINSIGSGKDATHTSGVTKFETPLDSGVNRRFSFDKVLVINRDIATDFKSKFSLTRRIIDKFKKHIEKL
ncbi:glycosyltransferase family protein [Costertonia aggregata]|uniref:Glycosyltransferase family 2 protein n=1 Tax=Costertonia aggregata TaxID=343403 RepID=A0A7H9AMR2_9FLAO|nr:glycosyltransferase [Costertonia aggregata]QLG44575.1 glycosyltransferase family 2 protein [Costertonia aggregata]